MRVLFACLPGTGHLAPLIPLATALRNAGHTVAFGAGSGFSPEVEGFGFESLTLGVEGEEWGEQAQLAWSSMPEQGHVDRIAAYGERVFGDVLARRVIEELPAVLRRWPADVIVHEDTVVGAAVAAEKAGIPHARFMVLASGPGHPVYSRMEGTMAGLREYAGLRPDTADATLHRHLLLYPFPPSLLAPDGVMPATFYAIRPSIPALTGAEQIPDWVSDLRRKRQPVVYGTLGTIFNKNDDVFAALLAALSATDDVQAVVTIGRDREVSEFGAVPEHVRVVQYIPLAALMPHLDLVVSHGGSGTLTAALAYGLPQVVLPMNADQPENAQRITALGAGIVVDSNEPSADRISAAVRAALSDPAYRAGARRVQSEIAQLPDVEKAIPLLQRIANGDQR
jgi:UDP:flavonoid glycosyltransferase YjiC (YdhE family)